VTRARGGVSVGRGEDVRDGNGDSVGEGRAVPDGGVGATALSWNRPMTYPPTPMTTRATAISPPAMFQWSFDPPVGSVIRPGRYSRSGRTSCVEVDRCSSAHTSRRSRTRPGSSRTGRGDPPKPGGGNLAARRAAWLQRAVPPSARHVTDRATTGRLRQSEDPAASRRRRSESLPPMDASPATSRACHERNRCAVARTTDCAAPT
jgi:hypothetical protein